MPYLTQLSVHPGILNVAQYNEEIVPQQILIMKSLHREFRTTIIGAQIQCFYLTLPFKLPELKPIERFRMVSTSTFFCTTILCQVRVKVGAVKKFKQAVCSGPLFGQQPVWQRFSFVDVALKCFSFFFFKQIRLLVFLFELILTSYYSALNSWLFAVSRDSVGEGCPLTHKF